MGQEKQPELPKPPESQNPADTSGETKSLYNYDKSALALERHMRQSSNQAMSSTDSVDGALIAQASDIYGQRGDDGLRPPTGTSDVQWEAFLGLMMKRHAKDPTDMTNTTDVIAQAVQTLAKDDPEKFDRVMRELAKQQPPLITIKETKGADGKMHVTQVNLKQAGHSEGEVLYRA